MQLFDIFLFPLLGLGAPLGLFVDKLSFKDFSLHLLEKFLAFFVEKYALEMLSFDHNVAHIFQSLVILHRLVQLVRHEQFVLKTL